MVFLSLFLRGGPLGRARRGRCITRDSYSLYSVRCSPARRCIGFGSSQDLPHICTPRQAATAYRALKSCLRWPGAAYWASKPTNSCSHRLAKPAIVTLLAERPIGLTATCSACIILCNRSQHSLYCSRQNPPNISKSVPRPLLRPVTAVQRAVLNSLCQVFDGDILHAFQICNGAGDLQNTVVRACTQALLLHRPFQQPLRV